MNEKGLRTGEIRVGVIGCGGFGLFMLQHLAQIPGVRLTSMADTHHEAAIAAAKRFGIPKISSVQELLGHDSVDLIYIATPPFLHHPRAMQALAAGKHVICEKPLAMSLKQTDEMIAAAKDRDLLLVANMMQRYNPLFDSVKRLIDSRILGEPLHGFFENCATDEGLPPGHWFWDRAKSGGIFIEHGVHFFDLFEGWLGPGKMESAQVSLRPGTKIEEQVQCTVRYAGNTLVTFHHDFCQAGRMDRQELRIVFERGDVTLHEWIPSRLRIRALADEAGTRALCDIFPGARLDISQVYSTRDRACTGRHKPIDAHQMFELNHGEGSSKMRLYGEALRALVRDQVAWIRDRNHPRRITERNGRDSLAIAVEADRLAHGPAA